MSALNRYFTSMRERTGFLPIWPPTTPVSPGDIVEFTGSQTRVVTSVNDALSPFKSTMQVKDEVVVDITDSLHASFTAGATGSVIEQKLQVLFTRASGYIFHSVNNRGVRITSTQAVDDVMSALDATARWAPSWVAITDVMVCDAVYAAVATAKGSSVSARLVPGSQPGLEQLGLSGSFDHISSGTLAFMGGKGSTPLVRGRRFTPRWLGRASVLQNAMDDHFLDESKVTIEDAEDWPAIS